MINVNVAALAQITFPDVLSFQFWENVDALSLSLSLSLSLILSHIEVTKPQRRESLALSLSGEKKLSGSRCILYHMYQKSHAQKDFPFLIGRNLRERD